MRTGILGGTFNPIHIGHLILAEEAFSKLKLDKVVFIPTYLPPHKDVEGKIKPKDRMKMVELAIEGNPAFECSSLEIDSRKMSYSGLRVRVSLGLLVERMRKRKLRLSVLYRK